MNGYILQVVPGTRFRFGKAQGVYPEEESNAQKGVSPLLHSDILYSALINIWALSHPDTLEEFIAACMSGKLKLSSGFYRVCHKKKNKEIFFLPKPICANLHSCRDMKKLRKLEFISKGIYEKGILPDQWFDREGECVIIQNGRIAALKEEFGDDFNPDNFKIYDIQTAPKVKVRNVNENGEGGFYYQTDLYLLGNEEYHADWYFFTENHLTDSLKEDFEDVMRLLVCFGIGGERSSGCGALEDCEKIDFRLKVDSASNACQMSVSIVIPAGNEMREEDMYKIVKRGGRYLSDGKSLPMVHGLVEGAIFYGDKSGSVVTLNEDPPVLRCGLSLTIPIHQSFII